MSAPETAWLVEMTEPEENRPPTPRWWHPKHGWMWDANKALRFAREVDASDYIAHGKTGASWLPGKATEHVFLAIADTHAKRGDDFSAPPPMSGGGAQSAIAQPSSSQSLSNGDE